MTLADTLLLLLTLQYAFFAAAWLAGVAVLSVPRAAGLHWMAYCLLGALAAGLFLSAEAWPLSLSLPLRNLSLLLAVMVLRRGTARFASRDPHDLEQGLVFGVAVAALALVGTDDGGFRMLALTLSAALGWVVLRAGLEQVQAVGSEVSRRAGWWLGLPLVVVGLAFLGRAAWALVALPEPERLYVKEPVPQATMLLGVLLVGSTLQQLSLFYLVMLRLVRRVRRLNREDPLTRLPNRAAWEQALQAERLQLRRQARPTAVLVLDVDQLGALNAQHGPTHGDRALFEVARRLELTARATDLVARLGGGCFGVLLPDTDEAGALEAAERQRLAVAGLNLMGRDARLTLTVSVGLAVLPASAQAADALTDLQALAQTALRRAKALGGNQVAQGGLPDAA